MKPTINILILIVFLPLFAWLHAYALWYIPIVIIRVGATGFICGGGSILSKLLAQYGIFSNRTMLSVLAVIVSLGLLYISWAIWLSLAINHTGNTHFLVFDFPITHADYDIVFQLLTNPAKMFDVMEKVRAVGTWGIRGSIFSGIMLGIVWLLELLVVIFATPKMMTAMLEEDL